ncbi:hypothetical protein BGZ60DRAFT_528097 [Tricladium varicosporioides]|nr:hypothetical protein BGZ60DRAFT_528097 [Hymenoscyphus varicosporioides]
MERLISDFALNPNTDDDSASPAVSEGSLPDNSPKGRQAKRPPAVALPSPIDETDFAWVIPDADMSENASIHHQEPSFDPAQAHSAGPRSYSGPCSIFSLKGIEWVNALVGDESFRHMLANMTPPKRVRYLEFDMSVREPLPDREILYMAIKFYFSKLNRDIRLFRDEQVIDGLQAYLAGTPCPSSGVGWYAAMNIIMAHVVRVEPEMMHLRGDSDKYLYNVLSVIPNMVLQPSQELCIGAMLSTTLYFMFSFENQAAMSILGSTMQQMIMSGYNYKTGPSGLSELDILHRRRLFWNGYILDKDLALRLGKPPIVSEHVHVDLPEEEPLDGLGIFALSNGSFHFLREHVALAMIQSQIWARLHSDKVAKQSSEELFQNIHELDDQLREWKENIPEILRPQTPLDRFDYDRLIFVTVLHYTYFQLTIAIHSVVFAGFTPHNTKERDARIFPSVALCVAAARASISLLNYHDNSHPFTLYLVNHVAWSVDILFMNILQNKSSPRILKDLAMLEKIVSFYECYDPDRDSSSAYKMTKLLYVVASNAVNKAQGKVITNGESSQPGQAISTPNGFASLDAAVAVNQSMFAPQTAATTEANSFSNGMTGMPFLESEWMMPLGFQPEYWQDPWANVFQDQPDMSDLSLN